MNIYSKRREKVFKSMSDDSAAILFSGEAIARSEDENYDFFVNRNFYYLTGLEKENMALLLFKDGSVCKEYLFILPYDEVLARWVGGRMTAEEVSEVSDVAAVEDYGELDNYVGSILNSFRINGNAKFYFDLWHYTMAQDSTPAIRYANRIKEKYPSIVLKDIYPILTKMRMIKDDYEIACLRQAIHTTRLGVESMMKSIRPSMNEMVMEGIFDFVLKQNLCNENAFNTIAASGQRATTLHYSDNNQTMNDGELFLCDLGATFKHYCADISRTFPVNGKFSDREREIYGIVLNAQRIVEENAKPGIGIRDLNKMVVDFYSAELPKHGLNKDVSEYYFHSVGHHLGLDTHDVSMERNAKLEAGNVITNEPGLYISDEGIGVRIEDDLLITGTGCEVLSKEIIKSIDDIEAFMSKD